MAENIPTKRPGENEDLAAPTPKRGRGRPPKDPSELLHSRNTPNIPKRGRGRPRKNSSELLHPRKDPNAPKRPRGRPRKDANLVVSSVKENTDTHKQGRWGKNIHNTTSSTKAHETLAKGSREIPGKKGASGADPEDSPSDDDSHSRASNEIPSPTAKSGPATSTNGPVRSNKNKKRDSKKALMLEDIIGTYTISCDEVEGNWPERAEEMSLSISSMGHQSGVLIASFDLGILEGTMLLTPTETLLERVCTQMQNSDRPASKAFSKAFLVNRTVYFAWRGRDVGDSDEVHYDPNSDQRGQIKFDDDKLVSFTGTGDFVSLGKDCQFSGTKDDNEPQGIAEPWSSFSEKAYTEANKRRWG